MHLTEIAFNEVPLVEKDGFAAAYCDGFADILYWRDGTFQIGCIVLDGLGTAVDAIHGATTVRARIPCPPYLQAILKQRLEESESWQRHIKDHVESQIRQMELA